VNDEDVPSIVAQPEANTANTISEISFFIASPLALIYVGGTILLDTGVVFEYLVHHLFCG
jgi:hypothetical protein